MPIIGGNIESKSFDLQIGLTGTYSNTEIDITTGKLRLKQIGIDDNNNPVYAKQGNWISNVIDIGDNFLDFDKIITTHIDENASSFIIYTKVSDDGVNWSEWTQINLDNEVQSETRRLIQVKIELFAGMSTNTYLISDFNNPSDVNLFTNNEYIETSNGLRLKRSYQYNMFKDNTWSEDGGLHRKLITRNDWVRIDKLSIKGNYQAIDFNKASSVILSGVPAYGTNFTVDLWLRLKSLTQTDYASLFMRGNATTANGVHIYGNKLGVRRATSGGLGDELEPISNLDVNTWYRLTFTYDNSTFKYYRDGVLIKSLSMTGSFSNSTDDICIGDWSDSYGTYLNGSVHDFKLYNKTLSDNELIELFNNRTYSPLFQSNLVIQVKLDGTDTNISKTIGTYTLTSFDKYHRNKSLILHDGEYKKIEYKFIGYGSKNLIPIMTSNTTPSGVASANGYIAITDQQPYKSFDGSIVNDRAWAIQAESGWLQYKFDTPKRVGRYVLIGELDPEYYMTASPKDFQLLASNDGKDWVVLDEQKNVTDWKFKKTKKVYNIHESKILNEYLYFRLNILSNNGSIYTSIGELELYEVILQPILKSISSTLPTSQQFISDGIEDLSIFNRQVTTLEPLPMADKSEILSSVDEGKVFSKTLNLKKYMDLRSLKVEVN